MNRVVLASLSFAVLAVAVLAWRGSVARDASIKARIQQQNDGRIVDGRFAFCGQTLRLNQLDQPYPNERQFTANGLQVYFKRLPSTDADPVVLSISSVEPFGKRCFDEDVQSPITVLLKCDPASAPIWSDFRERTWRVRSERPAQGLIALEGDAERRLRGINFVAMPAAGEQRDGLPFQARCHSDPGVLRPAEHCNVAYRVGRVGVDYVFLTRSMRPWREVDEAVRSTLAGRPSTPRCPAPAPF